MTEETYDRIHSYLLGRMPEGDRLAFQEEIAADAALAEAVDLERELMALVRYDGRRGLKARIVKGPRRRRFPRWAGVGTLLAVAAGIALLVWFGWMRNGDAALADRYFGHFEVGEVDRLVRAEAAKSPLSVPLERYRAGEYAAAIEALQTATDSLDAGKAGFLRAECLYRLGEIDSAIVGYGRVLELVEPDAEIDRVARFHRALAWLRKGDRAQALQQLQALLRDQGDDMSSAMREDVTSLLDTLND